MAPDPNVLLAASRTDHPQHKPARRWPEQALAACETGGSVEILPMVAAGFLRLATNPRVFVVPASIEAATAFLDSVLSVPGVDMPELGREWPTFRHLVEANLQVGLSFIPPSGRPFVHSTPNASSTLPGRPIRLT